MRVAERKALRQRYAFRCGYCDVSETEIGAELTVDHFQPRSAGGADTEENWVYCCHACNEFKGDFWQPQAIQRLLHPLRDNMNTHLALLDDGILKGITETGRFHIEHLHLNRPQLVTHRHERHLREMSIQQQKDETRRIAQLEKRLNFLLDQLGYSQTNGSESQN